MKNQRISNMFHCECLSSVWSQITIRSHINDSLIRSFPFHWIETKSRAKRFTRCLEMHQGNIFRLHWSVHFQSQLLHYFSKFFIWVKCESNPNTLYAHQCRCAKARQVMYVSESLFCFCFCLVLFIRQRTCKSRTPFLEVASGWNTVSRV